MRLLLGLAALLLAWWLLRRLGFDHLGQPWALAGLLGLLPLGWVLRGSMQRQRQRLQALIEHPLLARMATGVPSGRMLTQGLLWLGVFACAAMALARPQGPPAMSQIFGQGIDLIFALDISDSTKAADADGFTSRLEASKQGIANVLPMLQGDRVGLLVFSGEAFPVAPFTSDYAALITLLAEVDNGMLPSATTDLGAMLSAAKDRFSQNKEDTGRALVIFSDGENEQGSYQSDLRALTEMGVKIFTVGVGTTQGARIPETSAMWGTMGYKTWQGEEVVTKLDEGALKTLAQAGQGSYLPLKAIDRLPRLLEAARSQMKTRTSVGSGAPVFEERYQPWLLLGLLLLGLERLIALRPPRAKPSTPAASPFRRILTGMMRAQPKIGVAMLLMVLLNSAWHWPWEGYLNGVLGQQDYNQKKYDKADQSYQKGLEAAPQNPDLLYNQGNTRYRSGKYDDAAQSYQKSLNAPGATPQEKAQSWYNLGNSLYRKGQQQGAKPDQDWQKAIDAYQQALKLNPRDTETLENLNFVQEQLHKQQQQQGNQGQNKQQNQQNKQNQQGQNQKNQNQNNNQGQQGKQNQPPKDQGSQDSQNQQGSKSPTSPYDNQFSDQDIQNYLDQREQQEQQDRDQFQRFPNAQQTPDPMSDPLEQMDPQKDPNVKDW